MAKISKSSSLHAALLLALILAVGVLPGGTQAPQGPLTPPSKREVTRIPLETAPEPPPIPLEEMIRRFTQKEDEFQRERSNYSYRRTIRVQELDEDTKAAGESQVTTELVIGADGKRYERVVAQAPSTLKRMKLALEDLETLARIPVFSLPTGELSHYDLTYAGKQPIDELNTYIFRVKPRQIERKRAYFEGVVWVDDPDLLIVKTFGKWVTEIGDVSSPELPFSTFETYRQLVDGKYWFPIYTRSDDTLKSKNGDLRVRLTIRWSDYKSLHPQGQANP